MATKNSSVSGQARVGRRTMGDRKPSTSRLEGATLVSLFERFYNAMVASGRSLVTLAGYRDNFRHFSDYLNANSIDRDVDEVTPDLIRAYMAWLLTTKRKWEGHLRQI